MQISGRKHISEEASHCVIYSLFLTSFLVLRWPDAWIHPIHWPHQARASLKDGDTRLEKAAATTGTCSRQAPQTKERCAQSVPRRGLPDQSGSTVRFIRRSAGTAASSGGSANPCSFSARSRLSEHTARPVRGARPCWRQFEIEPLG